MATGPLARALADEVKSRTAARGWSGRETARRVGIPHNTLAVKLRAAVAFDVDELATVAAALDTSPAELVEAASHSLG